MGTVNVGTITIIPVPVITGLSRKAALAGSTVTLQVTGTTLTGSTFAFQPTSSTPIGLQVVSVDPSGTTAILTLTIDLNTVGTFALVATNIAGSSSSSTTPMNRFTIINPRSNADSDGDGFPDVVEAGFGTDPLDPTSFPSLSQLTGGAGETVGVIFSVLNACTSAPCGTQPTQRETDGILSSVLNNGGIGGGKPVQRETDGLLFSVLNTGGAGGGLSAQHESDGILFSVQNGTSGALVRKGRPHTPPQLPDSDGDGYLMHSRLPSVLTRMIATAYQSFNRP